MDNSSLKFMLAYDSFIRYIYVSYSSDWTKLKKASLAQFSSKYPADVQLLDETAVNLSFKENFFEWFVEIFLNFVHLKSSEPPCATDTLVYKVSVIIDKFTQNDFQIENLGNFNEKQIDFLKNALAQLNNRSSNQQSSQQHQNKKKKSTLEDIKPSQFIDFNVSKDFISSLMNKELRYKHHLRIIEAHRSKKDANGLPMKSTPASLFFNRFSRPFLSDDLVYVEEYNKLIENFN